jgi:hypothetical protein
VCAQVRKQKLCLIEPCAYTCTLVLITIHSFGSVITALLSLKISLLKFLYLVVAWCITKLEGESVGMLPDWVVYPCLVQMLPVYNRPQLFVDTVLHVPHSHAIEVGHTCTA